MQHRHTITLGALLAFLLLASACNHQAEAPAPQLAPATASAADTISGGQLDAVASEDTGPCTGTVLIKLHAIGIDTTLADRDPAVVASTAQSLARPAWPDDDDTRQSPTDSWAWESSQRLALLEQHRLRC